MFKAAFPYAQAEEEIAEKDYIKNLSDTASEEVAGNVWIHPDQGGWLPSQPVTCRFISAKLTFT